MINFKRIERWEFSHYRKTVRRKINKILKKKKKKKKKKKGSGK